MKTASRPAYLVGYKHMAEMTPVTPRASLALLPGIMPVFVFVFFVFFSLPEVIFLKIRRIQLPNRKSFVD